MKDAIANFITKHPFLTYFLAGTMIEAVKVIVRGYPKNTSVSVTTDGEAVKIEPDLEEVEVVDEKTES